MTLLFTWEMGTAIQPLVNITSVGILEKMTTTNISQRIKFYYNDVIFHNQARPRPKGFGDGWSSFLILPLFGAKLKIVSFVI